MPKFIAIGAILASFAAIHAQDASNPADLIRSAEAAVRKADYATADTLYARAAAGPDRAEIAPALWYLGARAAGQNNRLAAQGFFERLLKVDARGPYAGRALTWMANLRSDDPAAAEALFKRALDVEPDGSADRAESLRSYSFFLRKQGRAAESEQMAEVATRVATQRNAGVAREALPAGTYRVGGGVTAPVLVFKKEPAYTEDARAGKVQGPVTLMVDIGPDGVARNFQVVRSLEPGLDQKAIEAVQQWQFKPGTKDGQPVTVRATIEVNFRLM